MPSSRDRRPDGIGPKAISVSSCRRRPDARKVSGDAMRGAASSLALARSRSRSWRGSTFNPCQLPASATAIKTFAIRSRSSSDRLAGLLPSAGPISPSIGSTAAATTRCPTCSVSQFAKGCLKALRQIASKTLSVYSFISMAAPTSSGQLISRARFGTAKRAVVSVSPVPAQLLNLPRRARKTGGGHSAPAAFFNSYRREEAPGEIRRTADACGSASAAEWPLQPRSILSGGAA